ncbi:MAG: DUF4249 domain-containing protein [Chitinophagaceae bacterium]|nr:DUF4249 domain-containing protein [Chitinophagaceae bacterium]
MRLFNMIGLVLCFVAAGSCSKQINEKELRFNKVPVVNCIFRPDSIWKVNVTMSGTGLNTSGEAVTNAAVKLYSSGILTEELAYVSNGNYISLNGFKPLVGVEYRVEVNIPGFPAITATDKIPNAILTNNIKTDTSAFSFSYNPFYDPVSVFNVDINLSDNEAAHKYYMLKPLYYEKDELKIYKVTSVTFDSLRSKNELRNEDSIRLAAIVGIPFYGKTAFIAKLNELFAPRAYPFSTAKYSEDGFFNIYYPQLFQFHPAFVNDLYFKQIQDFYFMVFAEKQIGQLFNNYSLRFNYQYYPGGSFSVINGEIIRKEAEFFLEVNTFSFAGYKYFSTYVQNISNRANPFTEQINTFSNINNGTGIFAGANVSRIKIW